MSRAATGGVRKRGVTWWLRYTVDGVRYEESAETGDERRARSLLARRRTEIRDGTWKAPGERVGLARVEEARVELERALDAAPEAKPITVTAYLDGWSAQRRVGGVRNIAGETQWFRDYVKPRLGERALTSITREDMRVLVETLTHTTSAKTKRPLSPRTVLHIYRTLSTAFADAVLDGTVTANPCTLRTRKRELPKKRDSNPQWRASAVYSRDECSAMISDQRIPLDRRVSYGLMLLAALRASEAAGRRWRDYDEKAQPLGKLTVATQADGAKGERTTKTDEVREIPVVPALAALLTEWKHSGFPMLFGRRPEPNDPIVPTRHDRTGRSFRDTSRMNENAVHDMKRADLGRRVPAALHSMRATFLSLLEVDGANMAIARRATHSAPTDVVGGYIRTSWADLCREVAKLRIDVPRGATVTALLRARAAEGENLRDNLGDNPSADPTKYAEKPWAQLDSKEHPAPVHAGFLDHPCHATRSSRGLETRRVA